MKQIKLPTTTKPDIRLFGEVTEGMLSEFFRQQAEVAKGNAVVLELSTSGGDADAGRRIAMELKLWQDEGQEVFFLGKSYVFSAGITIMGAIPQPYRFLTADTELLIHERKIDKKIRLDGSLRGCRSQIQNVLAEIDSGQRLEHSDFSKLVNGTKLTVEDVLQKVMDSDWYLSAAHAKEVGLIADVI
ncbi:ATP-dependent Clp protease proteolytic subunit [Hydrogenophaga sp.]|uniref:ATP-dependent Clp protease proteolytic subunit n=1 Tax=Hydrogenophaga sp. TaxID=1904254 RepID=UPI0027162326|nr:ATP-dependent Clp protease proteolytic subunit [Hydrogenophaga sp.]MDO9434889.1 ATP-dependent Clp protease proteolytic subunit [Hydrogenophaga sp.]